MAVGLPKKRVFNEIFRDHKYDVALSNKGHFLKRCDLKNIKWILNLPKTCLFIKIDIDIIVFLSIIMIYYVIMIIIIRI